MFLQKEKTYWSQKGALITAKEIDQQPRLWQETYWRLEQNRKELKEFLDSKLRKKGLRIILTGAGSSAFGGEITVPYIRSKLECSVEAIATTDIVTNPLNYLKQSVPTLMISFARSGNSPESVAAVNLANECIDDVSHLFLTCNKNGKLHRFAMEKENVFSLLMPEDANDQGFAMTGSLTTMSLASMLLCHLDDLQSKRQEIAAVGMRGEQYKDFIIPVIQKLLNEQFERFVYLGSGCLAGVARESALKTLELCAGTSTTHYDSVLGFRHGPKSVVNDKTLVVLYFSNDPYSRQYEIDLLHELVDGGRGEVVSVTDGYDSEIEEVSDYYMHVSDDNVVGMDDAFLSFPYLLTAQILAFHYSLKLGLTPDNPSPNGFVNRVVKGVHIYPFIQE